MSGAYGGPPTPHLVPEGSIDAGGSPSSPEAAEAGAPDASR